ncbi:Abi family protein [Pseudoalteromonas sp. T1lg76]|uniref:Abi family protein n=1 Tax=Pseudoalteromonas sp. T1lg76 TaxID=2077103 RepID=UPI000CF7273D|nr:Abi family protein [Pseudoalteromonas sp. T1lg76]
MEFDKPPLSFEQQLDRLIERGMRVTDRPRALAYLRHINYYRLGTYWWSFIGDHNTHQFKPDTSFESVLNLYVFDRELRLLLLDAIERVEVSLRTQWAYHVAKEGGSHAHLNKELFNAKDFAHDSFLDNLLSEVNRTSDRNIKKQAQKYQEATPAIWIISEVMSFGWLSRCYGNLKRRRIRMDIAQVYDLNEAVLASFLHHLTTARNICAHHARLWNRDFTFRMKLPHNGPDYLIQSLNAHSPRELYNTLVMLAFLLDKISPEHSWKSRLKALIDNHDIDTAPMGFPEHWQQLPMWQ